jgi:hypothetical protein
MTDIVESDTTSNPRRAVGDGNPSKFRVRDWLDRYGELAKDKSWLAWAKSQYREAMVAKRWPDRCEAYLRLLIILVERFNGDSGYAWPSHTELADKTDTCRRTGIRGTTWLEEGNFIIAKARSKRRGVNNQYLLNFDRAPLVAATAALFAEGGVTPQEAIKAVTKAAGQPVTPTDGDKPDKPENRFSGGLPVTPTESH